jgi:hypothetical protein
MIKSQIWKIVIKLTMFLFDVNNHSDTKRFMKLLFHMLKCNGSLWTIAYMKQVRLHITRYMVGKPLMVNDKRVSLIRGFPTRFMFLRKYIDSGRLSEIKFILTLLNVSKCITPKKGEEWPVDYSTITNPYKGKVYTIPKWFIQKWLKDRGLRAYTPHYSLDDFYVSMKSSPTGPALMSLWTAIIHCSYGTLQTFLNIMNCKSHFKSSYWCYSVNLNDLFNKFYTWAFNNYSDLPKDLNRDRGLKSLRIGKLAIVDAPEGKKRVIATVDYFTQFLLRKIGMEIFRNLRKLPSDRTFTQNPHNNWLGTDSFYSLDLSAATDRFPIALQAKVLKYLFKNDDLARNWVHLLIDREFELPGDTIEYVKYSVGQPMGAHSSWAMFSLTHHLTVAWAAHLCGKDNFNNYILLGDDIVIRDNKVANKYITIMTRLGVDISVAKTHVSKDTYEFAKRWIRGSLELTGVPLHGLVANITNPKIVFTILYDYVIRNGNLYLYKGSLPNLVLNLYKGMTFKRYIRKDKRWISYSFPYKLLRNTLVRFNTMVRITQGLATLEEQRQLLGWATRDNEQFVLPNEKDMPLLMKGVLSKGLVSMAYSANNKVIGLYNQLKSFCEERLLITDINDLYYQPFFHAIYSHLRRVRAELYNYIQKDDFTLVDALDRIMYIDFDVLTAFRRNPRVHVANMDKLYSKSFTLIRKPIDELYYGSWSGVDSESVTSWAVSLEMNHEQLLNELTAVRNRSVTLPSDLNDWESAWDIPGEQSPWTPWHRPHGEDLK